MQLLFVSKAPLFCCLQCCGIVWAGAAAHVQEGTAPLGMPKTAACRVCARVARLFQRVCARLYIFYGWRLLHLLCI